MSKKPKPPQIAYIDGDSLLFISASSASTTMYEYRDQEGNLIAKFPSADAGKSWISNIEVLGFDDAHGFTGDVDTLTREKIVTPDDDIETAKKTFNTMVKRWVKQSGCKDYVVYIGAKKGQRVFRHDLATIAEYKGNRKGQEKPPLLNKVRKWASQQPNVKVARGAVEVDDLVVAYTERKGEKACLIGVDKDAKQVVGCWLMIPDEHDKPVFSKPDIVGRIGLKSNGKVKCIGWLALLFQMIKGDSVDNIKALPRHGDKKAYDILKEFDNKPISALPDAVRAVLSHYYKQYGLTYQYTHWDGSQTLTRSYKEMFEENLRLLYMLRSKDDDASVIMDIVNSVKDEEMESE